MKRHHTRLVSKRHCFHHAEDAVKTRSSNSTPSARGIFVATLLVGMGSIGLPAAAAQGSSAQSESSMEMISVLARNRTIPALERTVSLELENVRLVDALQKIADEADLRLSYARRLLDPNARVTLQADRIKVAEAVARVLDGSGLDLLVALSGQAVLVRKPEPEKMPEPVAAVGSIAGRVTDAANGAGVSGASVTIEGTRFGAVTGNTGRYRIANVPAGMYTMIVQQIGYADAGQSVTVSDGGDATVDFALEVSALPLDAIVATGTAFETRLRTVPNPISVMTAREIEQKQATNITDLLLGEIPGVLALQNGASDYQSRIYVRGNEMWTAPGDYIKIYIDGVEVASPSLLSTIDPKSIERLEVVRGPQASAIYGSEAASGVLQIFTKKGRPGLDRPRLDLQASAGVVESLYKPAGSTPLIQDHSLGVTGGEESFSYRAGMSYQTMGEWVKDYGSRTLGFSGGLRSVHGPLTAELSALRSNRDFDPTSYSRLCNYPGYIALSDRNAVQCSANYRSTGAFVLSQSTMGLTLTYEATPKWQHTLVLGDDQNHFAFHQKEPNHLTPADTFVSLSNFDYRRRSVRYTTAYETTALGESFAGRFTLGAEMSNYDIVGTSASDLLDAFGTVQTSPQTSASFSNDAYRNAGYFGLAEIGLKDQLFLTLAARLEEMRNLGKDYGRPVQPRVGVAYVRKIGLVEMKLRAEWGKGVRSPPANARAGTVSSTSIYLSNSEIGPEEKVGWDAGIDIYWGNRGALSLTRYDEEGKNLIMPVDIDLTAMPIVRQYQNVGVVGNEGWELEGTLSLGWFSMKANYAYADNRILKLSNSYQPGPNAQHQEGDRPLDVPKHSGGGTLAVRFGRGSISLNGTVLGPRRQLDVDAYYGYIYGDSPYRGSMRAYFVDVPSLWKWHLRAEGAVTEGVTAFLRVDNIWANQDDVFSSALVSPGRLTVLGVRATY